jgi:iron complex transport system ATP-binding protein
MIRIDNITQWARTPAGRKILDSISCTILPGKLTVLLGPNGAGKSTLLRIVSGEKKPHAGTVFLDNQSIHSIPIRQLALQRGMLTQQYSVSLPFTVAEVVTMGRYAHYRNSPSAKDRRIVSECLQQMQVAHLSDRLFNTLSGGEQQRVQMARVLAQLGDGAADSRKILLLDEPTASMDLLHQQQCLGKARELAEQGYTVVAVLHDLNLAAQFADSLLLLKEGKLLAGGSPSDILEPGLIYKAYGMETAIIYPDQYDFPVIIPTLSKDIPALPGNSLVIPKNNLAPYKENQAPHEENNYFPTPVNEKIYANDLSKTK